MEYRRFGKTNKNLSAITLGGMRFLHGWDEPRNEILSDTREHCQQVVSMAFDYGINHIETAFGYKKSEHALGMVLNEDLKIPRNSYLLMTKGNAMTASEMRSMVEKQLTALQTDYFDFYGWHGINNAELLSKSCAKNGPVEELLKLKQEGVIKHVGFSTHGPVEVICDAINNWIDTEGRRQGLMTLRTINGDAPPVVSSRVVKITQLDDELPADSLRLTEEERRKQVMVRREHMASRFHR